MSWSKHGGGKSGGEPPRGYHHGNLKEALIRAALELIAQEGPGGVHLRGSRALGRRQPGGALSAFSRPRRTALRCRAARLRAIRAGAVARLGRRQAGSVGSVRPPRQGLSRSSRAPSPRTTRRCSRPAFRSTAIPSCARPATARSPCCARRPKRLVATMPAKNRPPVLMMALHIWALSHGIASLFGRGDAARRKLPMAPEELLEAGVLLYLRGPRAAGGVGRASPETAGRILNFRPPPLTGRARPI